MRIAPMKTYLSFVLLFAFVLSSHVLTHELLHEDMNDDEEIDPLKDLISDSNDDEEIDLLKDLTGDSSVAYKPNGNWGITIGPEPNDEFDDEDFSSGEYSGGHRSRHYGGGGGSGRYNNYPRGGHGRGGGDDYDDESDDYENYNNRQNNYNHRRYRRHSVESVHPQSSNLQNSEMMMKNYDLDGNKIQHGKRSGPTKCITHGNGVKKGYEEVGKKPMN